MAIKEEIYKFKPAHFEKKEFCLEKLNDYYGKDLFYASKGRWALYHILRTYPEIVTLLVPAFICETILEPIKLLNIKIIYYDVDEKDLNFSITSIEEIISQKKADGILVASMYGNPGDLEQLEKVCREKEIVLIDDAAQSFMAKLKDRPVGSFGNAGFFSLSPGKPTAGHMGAFFWSDRKVLITYKKNTFYHLITYLDFYFNRLNIDIYKKFKLFSLISIFKKLILDKYIKVDIKNDQMCNFEKVLIGGVVHGALEGKFSFRASYFNEFKSKFESCRYFKVLSGIRGECYPHKIVLIFNKVEVAERFRKVMLLNNIYCAKAYRSLDKNYQHAKILKKIENKIVEIPIEEEESKMTYLVELVKNFINGEKDDAR